MDEVMISTAREAEALVSFKAVIREADCELVELVTASLRVSLTDLKSPAITIVDVAADATAVSAGLKAAADVDDSDVKAWTAGEAEASV